MKMGVRNIGCEDRRWIELAQVRVRWQNVILTVPNLRVLLPHS
jgi:hypothetical protein